MHCPSACHFHSNFYADSWKYRVVNKPKSPPHLVALQGSFPGRERLDQIGSVQKAAATAVHATGQQTNKAIQFPGL